MLVNADIFGDIEGFGDNLEEYVHENNAFDALLNYQEQFYGSHEPLQNISEPMQYRHEQPEYYQDNLIDFRAQALAYQNDLDAFRAATGEDQNKTSTRVSNNHVSKRSSTNNSKPSTTILYAIRVHIRCKF